MKAGNELRAAGVVASVYGYFLIFAQFAFVELLRERGVETGGEKLALGLMAFSGVATGFCVARKGVTAGILRLSLGACVIAAVAGAWAPGILSLMAVAVITGAGVGAATVALATLLPGWCSVGWIGFGTGLGYALCNVPWVFSAEPSKQALFGAGFAVVGFIAIPEAGMRTQRITASPSTVLGSAVAILGFLALVWLDSAAFFIIQHQRELKEATWGDAMLWRNAVLHLSAAMVAGGCLERRWWRGLLLAAWAILALAALAVNGEETRILAGWWYPVGVSLYSTVLVAWPGYLGGGNERAVAWRAAWAFAVAGWFGSANGIGMAETLQRVPETFVGLAGAVVLISQLGSKRWPAMVAVGAVLIAAWGISPTNDKPGTAVERGRQVYLEEGCITCHSRYVRSTDPDGWGPPADLGEILREKPVLIGNRRQGPDLSNVGSRRSAAWLREHFINPRAFVRDSPMPSYAHLFLDQRGDDLIAFLAFDQDQARIWRSERTLEWKPGDHAGGDGEKLFAVHCAVCHGTDARGDGVMSDRLAKRPPNLVEGPFIWTADATTIARAIKWGLPGTDMPGHELLSDEEVADLAVWVLGLRGNTETPR